MAQRSAFARVLATLRATAAGGAAFLWVYLVAPWFVLHARWTGRVGPLYRISQRGCRLVLWLGGIRFEVRGEENLPRGRACVYMSNHQSNLDPPMLFLLLPPRIAMMGKIQVFSVPVLGEAVRLADFVPVDRDNPEEARKSVEEALPRLRRGVSFLVFPEGRRSWDGRLLRFKHGVFLLAIRAGVPIVPITVDGVTDAMPKGKWEIYPGRAQVTIHPPIETRGMQEGDRARLAQQVRTIVDSALSPELRDPELTTAAATPPRQG